MVEYVLKNEKGNSVVQADIHREIQEHIRLCQEHGKKNCGILAPWGHGKTEQVIAFALDEIGKDQNIRIQLICNSDDNAVARVTSIAKYIEEVDEYHLLYPEVKKGEGTKDSWGKHKLVIKRDSKSKDGTLEAWGINTSGTGSRCDLQIFDDPVDLRNAILNPAERAKVKESFRNVWQSRLISDGFRVYIATVWHEDDLTHELMASKSWNFLIMKVSDDFKHINCESCFKGKFQIDLWELWNEPKLKAQYEDIGARAFDRGYRQNAMTDEDRTFPSSEKVFRPDLDTSSILPHWPRVMGIDPFGQAVVLFTLGINPHNKMRFVERIYRKKMPPKKTVAMILEMYMKYRHQFIVCENNAAQEAIVQWVTEVAGPTLPIIPFCTGKQKADPELGLPSIEVEFANGAWICPYKGIELTDAEHPINVWRKEMRGHPVAEAEDTVMAMWFAREGARMLDFQPQPDEETVTPEDIHEEVEEVSIGDYD